MPEHALTGRVALVVGAAGGIGRAIARTLAGAGAAVACVDIDETGARAAQVEIESQGGRALALRADASRAEDATAAVEATVAAFGGLEVLVYSAADNDPTATVLELSHEAWQRTLAVNLTGAFLACKTALPAMIQRGRGSIILVASQLGRVGSPGRPAYCSTKGALIQLAKVMAIDHAGQGIRVNTLSPGAVETGRMTYRYGDMDAARRSLGPKHVLGRLGQPREIAQAALFLASDASSFMTGADLLVDGGFTAV